MKFLQTTALAGLAAVIFGQTITEAEAGNRWRWRFLQPEYVEREYYYDDNIYADEEYAIIDEAEEYYQEQKRLKKKKKRNIIVYEDEDEVWIDDDFEPVKPKAKKKTPKKQVTIKQKPVTKKQLAALEEPTVLKPVAKKPLEAAIIKKPVAKKPVESTKLSAKGSLPLDAETLSKPLPKAIGCSNGIEIISGYGFSGVKPKSCSGATYTFDAKRSNKNYLISLSAKTGEITDVKKIN
jgi:hypothetical protein